MFELLIPVIVFAGFLVGGLLAMVSPEEMQPGRIYFIWLLRVLALSIFAYLLYLGSFDLYGLTAFVLGTVFGFFIRSYHASIGLAVAMVTLLSQDVMVLFGSLAFAFSLVHGTLNYSSHKFTLKRVLLRALFFSVPLLVLFTPLPPEPVIMFAAGSLATGFIANSSPRI